MSPQNTALTELEKEIEKESNFEEILEEYHTLSGVSDGSFLTVPILDIYKTTAEETLLLKFEIIDGLTGFINIPLYSYQTSVHSKVLFSAISERDSDEWSLELELHEDFHSGTVLADGEGIEVDVTWEDQLNDDSYLKVDEHRVGRYLEKAVCGTYFQEHNGEYEFVQSEIDTVRSDETGDTIELEVTWFGQNLVWSIPALTSKGGERTIEFLSAYNGLGSLDTSQVYITNKQHTSELPEAVYFEDTSSDWIMISKDAYSEYISKQKEIQKTNQTTLSDRITETDIIIFLLHVITTLVIFGIVATMAMDIITSV